MATENARSAGELVRRAIDDPASATADLPRLLAALEADDPAVRVGAAAAICAVAAERPDAAARLRDRLRGLDTSAATLAAEWIERECDVGDEPSATTAASGRSEGDEVGGDDAPPEPDDGAAALADLDRGDAAASAGGEPIEDAESIDDEESIEDAEPNRNRSARSASESSGPPGTDAVVENGRFTIELDRTALDRLEIVDRVATDRHCWTYAGMATIDATETAVLVRTYRPPRGARLSTFAPAFEEVVERWAGVDDHDGVLTVHDYGRRPHPWVVLGYAPATLRSAGRLPPLAALQVAYDAASALAHAHERGVTHRSLDPRSLAVDPGGDRPSGRLLNVGIVDAYRAVDGPLPMDSRFGAPELFGDAFGGVDHATDVYQLGAVLYTAATGRPPYSQSLVERGGPVGEPRAPPSSVVDDLPDDVDRIVETAMATHKIARYESAGELALDLREAASDLGGSV